MKPYKFCWELHKWIGIVLSIVLINISVTGLLLLEKKNCEWIQPATRQGQEGTPADFISVQTALDAVLDCNHPDFPDLDSIDRIDMRPNKRVFKVRSETSYAEIQIDAMTGKILNRGIRNSDMLEQLHDGSLFGDQAHDLLMPTVAVTNIVLALSGLYLWLAPKLKKKKSLSSN
jgi:uncharacterized iron-regulated membrane protein